MPVPVRQVRARHTADTVTVYQAAYPLPADVAAVIGATTP